VTAPANLRGWGQGWPVNRSSEMKWVRAARSGAKWQVHQGIVPIVEYIVNEVERRGYLFDHGPNDVDDEWGYNNRPIRGKKVPSNHSWGLAIDIDAQQYPMGVKRNPPQWITDLFDQYQFDHGGAWRRPDGMHYEFRGWPSDARMLTAMLAAGHLGHGPIATPPSVPAPPPFTPLAPTRPQEDDDMDRIYKRTGKDQFWFRDSTGKSAWISKAEATNAQANAMKANTSLPVYEFGDSALSELGFILPK